jgi:hypothetical protein
VRAALLGRDPVLRFGDSPLSTNFRKSVAKKREPTFRLRLTFGAAVAFAKVRHVRTGAQASGDTRSRKKIYDRADNLLAEIIKPFLETCRHCGGANLKEGAVIVLNEDGRTADSITSQARKLSGAGIGQALRGSRFGRRKPGGRSDCHAPARGAVPSWADIDKSFTCA